MSTKKLIVIYDRALKSDNIDYNPVCWDNSIHTRLSIFGSNSIDSTVAGFSDKLSFLLTLMANDIFSTSKLKKEIEASNLELTDDLKKLIFNNVTNQIYTSLDYLKILNECSKKFILDNQIKISPCVCSTDKIEAENKILGKVLANIEYTNVDNFIKDLNIESLEKFLFEDAYYLKLVEAKDTKKDLYDKFYKRSAKKNLKSNDKSKFVDLW